MNAALASVDHFCRILGVGSPDVGRDQLPAQALRALTDAELRSVIRAAIRESNARDTAAVALMALAGLRVAETVGLYVGDVSISARKGSVTVRRGKGDSGRTVPLSTEARSLIEPWAHRSPIPTEGPLFVGPAGRLSSKSVDRLTRKVGALPGDHAALLPPDRGGPRGRCRSRGNRSVRAQSAWCSQAGSTGSGGHRGPCLDHRSSRAMNGAVRRPCEQFFPVKERNQ